jgi:hypothetical protein
MVRFSFTPHRIAKAVAWLLVAAASLPSLAVAQSDCAVRSTTPANAYSLNVDTASYFGRGANDAINAVEYAPDCTLLVGGRTTVGGGGAFIDVSTVNSPLAPALSSSTGSVARLSRDGTTLLARSIFGAQVNDLAVNKTNGDVAVASDVALALMASDLRTVRWSVAGGANRVSITSDGRVAALFGKTLRIYAANGARLSETPINEAQVYDVAIDAASGLAFVTGFGQRDGRACSQLQVAWIRAYELGAQTPPTGATLRWRAYDYALGVADTHNDCADTRGRLVTIGEDGKLYFAGTSAGGNAIFRWDPQTRLNSAELYPPSGAWPAAFNVKPDGDNYVDAFNTKSNHITYLARFDPASGRQEAGFFLLSRLGVATDANPNGNTIEPRALAADREGRIYAGGFSAYQIENREKATINGTLLSAYSGGDAWLLVTSPDYAQRETWVVFTDGGNATVNGIAVSRGAAAIGAIVDKPGVYIGSGALQATAPTLTTEKSGYFATFKVPAAPTTARCSFDIDGDGDVNAAVDGLVLLRYLQNVTGNSIVARTGIATSGVNAARARASLARATLALDIDGNGVVDAATDGVLLLRGLLGFKGVALIANALGAAPSSGTWRNTAPAVEAYLATQCVI